MTAQLSPTPVQKFFDNNGNPLFRGTLTTYAAGTTTPQATYVDSTQTTQNTNPITLNFRGECNLWLDPTLSYKLVLKDFFGNTIWTVDNVAGGSIPALISQGLIPNPTNTYTLGNSTHSWEQLYLGANASPALNTVSGIIGYYPRTVAEISAGVTPTNYAYGPFDLRRYGLTVGGSIDTPLSNGIAVCKQAGGGRLYIPASSTPYTSAAQINLNQCNSIIIYGDGAATAGSGVVNTTIKYTGGGSSPWFLMTSAFGCQIRNLQLTDNGTGYTGVYVKCGNDGTHGDSFQCSVIDVIFNASTTPFHLDLDKVINFNAERCYFAGGATSVKGQTNSSTSYSTTVRFNNCVWGQTLSIPINWGGWSWLFEGCTFEGVYTGTPNHFTAGAFQCGSTTQNSGLTFIGCWFGDATDTGGTWISTFGPGFTFTGNMMAGDPSPGSFGITLNGVSGACITGNDFLGLSVVVNLASSTTKGLVFTGNSVNNNVTTIIGGAASFGDGSTSQVNPNNGLVGAAGGLTPFFAAAAQGWEYTANGNLEIWGVKTITAGTGATLTYATEVTNFPGFSTAVFNSQVSAENPSSTINCVYCGTPGLTSMNINANGTGTVAVFWRIKGK